MVGSSVESRQSVRSEVGCWRLGVLEFEIGIKIDWVGLWRGSEVEEDEECVDSCWCWCR